MSHSFVDRQKFEREDSNLSFDRKQKSRQKSPQIRIYNRNVYLRQAYKSMVQENRQKQIKSLANSKKLFHSSYNLLKQKMQHEIVEAIRMQCQNNQDQHQEEMTYQQMCEVVFKTNQYLRKAEKYLDVEQLLSQLWLYLKGYDIQNEYLDLNVFYTFIKVLMDPKIIRPAQIKHLMMEIEGFCKSSELKRLFIQKYPQLEDQALEDIELFKLWFAVKQKYNGFSKNSDSQKSLQRRSRFKDQCTFQPQISQTSRIYAQKSLNKYMSSNKLNYQKGVDFHRTNQQQNELNQYLSQKGTVSVHRQQQNDFSYHNLLYKRRLQKQSVSRKQPCQDQLKQNQRSRRVTASEVKQIVDNLYYVPEKKQDFDYKSKKQLDQLKVCTFHPQTNQYDYTKTTTLHASNVNGFQKQVNRLKKGRQEKQKLKQIYQNLGRPKNVKSHARTPSFLQRQTPKLILQVNIGNGKVQKIKLHGNQDPKIVAKKFINRHSLQSSMMSVLEDLIDQNLRKL